MLRALPILLVLATSATAAAQTPTAFVALYDLDVEGRAPPASLREQLDDNTTGVMHGIDVCYAGRHSARGELAGDLRLRLWVSAQQVIRVTPESATFTDDELVQCVKRVLLAFRLPPDAPRAGVNVRFRLVFTAPPVGQAIRCDATSCAAQPCGELDQPCCPAGACTEGECSADATCRVPAPPPPPPVAVTVTRAQGGMTMADVTALFPATLFAACVDGTVVGTVPFSVTITRAGRVRGSALASTVRDRATITCLRTTLNAVVAPTRTRTSAARLSIAVGTR